MKNLFILGFIGYGLNSWANESIQKKECKREVQSLIFEAQMEARNNNPPGNLAKGKAARIYHNAKMKSAYCSKLK